MKKKVATKETREQWVAKVTRAAWAAAPANDAAAAAAAEAGWAEEYGPDDIVAFRVKGKAVCCPTDKERKAMEDKKKHYRYDCILFRDEVEAHFYCDRCKQRIC